MPSVSGTTPLASNIVTPTPIVSVDAGTGTDMRDPPVISIDIETYGIAECDHKGREQPRQRYFHPLKELQWDNPPQLLMTCSITVPSVKTDAPTAVPFSGTDAKPFTWDAATIAQLTPGETMVLDLWRPTHLDILKAWLRKTHTLIGMNLLFDLTNLRTLPELRGLLSGGHTILDLSVINYLHNENRKERSLKNIGPILRLYSYEEEILQSEHRFTNLDEMRDYNGQDTHNSILACAELARRIQIDYGDSPKLSPWCNSFFSDSIWHCLRLTEAGIPLDLGYLLHLEGVLYFKATLADRIARKRYGFPLSGDGSSKAKSAVLHEAFDAVLSIDPDFVDRNHHLLKWTDVKRDLSTNDLNRLLIARALPPDHPTQGIFRLWDINSSAHKLLSTYIRPLLRTGNNKKAPNDTTALPVKHLQCLTSPKWRSSSSSTSSSCSLCGAAIVPPEPPDAAVVRFRRRTPSQHRKRRFNPKPPTGKPDLRRFYDEVPLDPPPPRPYVKNNTGVCFPAWFLLPSPFKDDGGEEGGQKQARLSSKSPASTTWPPTIKQALTSRWPGGCVATFDLSQIELCSAALLSGCPSLLNPLAANLDLHTDRAISVYGFDALARIYSPEAVTAWHTKASGKFPGRPDFDNNFRQPCKHANFTDLNLGGAATLQATILKKSKGKIFHPLDKCEEIVRRRPIDRPGLFAWQMEHIERVQREGVYVLPFTGISRYFLGGEDFVESEIVNLPIQGTAATLMRCILHWLDRHFLPPLTHPRPDVYCCNVVYDAAFFDCKTRTRAEDLNHAIAKAIEYVSTSGYWAWMQELTGNVVAVKYDFKILDPQ